MANKAGALKSWAHTEDRQRRTKPGRDAFLERFEREVDPEGVLPEKQRLERAKLLRRARMLQLSRGGQRRYGGRVREGSRMRHATMTDARSSALTIEIDQAHEQTAAEDERKLAEA